MALTALPVVQAMPRTSPAINKAVVIRGRSAGFTFVEISVVLVVLFIIASMVFANLATVTKSRALKDLEGKVARLPTPARNDAVRLNTPVQLRIQGTTLVEEQVPDSGEPTQLTNLDLGQDLTVDRVQLNGQDSDSGTWTWTAYPDGSSDSGGIEFSESGAQKALVLPSTGGAEWVNGALPDETQDTWPAGVYLQRSS
jgi:hypothetical protein